MIVRQTPQENCKTEIGRKYNQMGVAKKKSGIQIGALARHYYSETDQKVIFSRPHCYLFYIQV